MATNSTCRPVACSRTTGTLLASPCGSSPVARSPTISRTAIPTPRPGVRRLPCSPTTTRAARSHSSLTTRSYLTPRSVVTGPAMHSIAPAARDRARIMLRTRLTSNVSFCRLYHWYRPFTSSFTSRKVDGLVHQGLPAFLVRPYISYGRSEIRSTYAACQLVFISRCIPGLRPTALDGGRPGCVTGRCANWYSLTVIHY